MLSQGVRDIALSTALAMISVRQRSSAYSPGDFENSIALVDFEAALLTPGFSPVQPTQQRTNRFHGLAVKRSRYNSLVAELLVTVG
jgi:hypothetical protein